MAILIPSRELSFGIAVKLIVPALYLCLFFDLFAGFFLGVNFEKIMEKYPHLLIILPGLMGLRGNIFGSLCSRLSTAFYLGSSTPTLKDVYVYKNALFSIWASTIPVLILLIIGYAKLHEVETFLASVQISLTSGVLIGIFLSFASVIIVSISFRKSVDPDSISGPIITSIADIVTVPSLIILILLFESGAIFLPLIFSLIILLLSLLLSFKREYLKIYREVVLIVSTLAVFQSFTGSFLEEFSEVVYLSIFMSFAYPSILDNLGNYGSIMVARTATKLNLGEIEKGSIGEAMEDAKYILPTSLLVFPFISFMPIAISYFVLDIVILNPIPILIFFLSYVFLVFLILLIAFYLGFLLYNLKIDPDNGGIPLVTTIADFFGTIYAVAIAYLFISV
ncbi:MAG: magnesium transporter [Archaeoglobaceae archaeon]